MTSLVPLGAARAAFLLALAGLGISAYLTIEHFRGVALSCPNSGIVNCTKVTTSPQSHVLGIPVALLGLLFYVVMAAVNLPPAWRSPDRRLAWVRVALVVAGMGFVLYLLVAELFVIGAICLWCTGVHVVTFAVFAVVLTSTPALLARR